MRCGGTPDPVQAPHPPIWIGGNSKRAIRRAVDQLTRPVRWDLCTETLRQRNVTAVVEFPPAGTLTGIAKRELRGIGTHAVKSPADLDGLTEL